MSHDGYVALVELDEEAGLFHGEVINTRDVLTFQGRALDELKTAFADTIDDYVEWCRERGSSPNALIPAISHCVCRPTCIAAAAARERKSVNAFIAAALDRVA
jgi:predicted HicB family RNase H-like nuclease